METKSVLLGFKGGDSISELSELLKNEYLKRDVDAHIDIRHSLKGVTDYLASNIGTEVLIIQEQFGERGSALDISFFDEITDLYPKLIVIAVLTNSRKGTDYVVHLMTHNCYNCIYESDANPSNIVKLSLSPRHKNDAKAYYSIRDRGLSDPTHISIEPSTAELTPVLATQIIEKLKIADDMLGPYSPVSIFEKAAGYLTDADLRKLIDMFDDDICQKLASSHIFKRYGGRSVQSAVFGEQETEPLRVGDSRATIKSSSLKFSLQEEQPVKVALKPDESTEKVSQKDRIHTEQANSKSEIFQAPESETDTETPVGMFGQLMGRFGVTSSRPEFMEEKEPKEPMKLGETIVKKVMEPVTFRTENGRPEQARKPIQDTKAPVIQRFDTVSGGGMRVIAVGGVEHAVGCTHTAISLATILRRMGYRVLVVEAGSRAMLHRLSEHREFRYEGIDIYVATNGDGTKDFGDCFSRPLDFMILDVGILNDRGQHGSMTAYSEMQRAQLSILTADPIHWRYKEAEILSVSMDIPKNWVLLYKPTCEKHQKRIKGDISGRFYQVLFSEYSPDPFSPSEMQEIILTEVLGTLVGGKKKKGLFSK